MASIDETAARPRSQDVEELKRIRRMAAAADQIGELKKRGIAANTILCAATRHVWDAIVN